MTHFSFKNVLIVFTTITIISAIKQAKLNQRFNIGGIKGKMKTSATEKHISVWTRIDC